MRPGRLHQHASLCAVAPVPAGVPPVLRHAAAAGGAGRGGAHHRDAARPDDPDDSGVFRAVRDLVAAVSGRTRIFSVSSTIAIDIVVRQCSYLRPRTKNLETIIAALICIATLFIRQHSIIDVALGFAMSWLLYFVWKWAVEPKISGSQAL